MLSVIIIMQTVKEVRHSLVHHMSGVFKGVKAFFAGVDLDSVKQELVENGGQAADRYSKSVTHIVFSGGTEQQASKALENNVPLVSPDWVFESKTAGTLLDVSKYFPDGKHAAKTSRRAPPKKKEEKAEKKQEKEQKSADIAGSEEETVESLMKIAAEVTTKSGNDFLDSQSPAPEEKKASKAKDLTKIVLDLSEKEDADSDEEGSGEAPFVASKTKPKKETQNPSAPKKESSSQQISQPIVSQPSFREEKKKEEKKNEFKAQEGNEGEAEAKKEEPKKKPPSKKPPLSKSAASKPPATSSPKKSIFSQEKPKLEDDEEVEEVEPPKPKDTKTKRIDKMPGDSEKRESKVKSTPKKPAKDEKEDEKKSKKTEEKAEKKGESKKALKEGKKQEAEEKKAEEEPKSQKASSQKTAGSSQQVKSKNEEKASTTPEVTATKKRKRVDSEAPKSVKKAKKDEIAENGEQKDKNVTTKPKKKSSKKSKKEDEDEEEEILLDDDEDEMDVSSEPIVDEEELIVKKKVIKRPREESGVEGASPAKKPRKKSKTQDIMSLKYRLVLTNIDPANLTTLTSIVKAKGDAVILDEVDDKVTHVVTGDDKRSLKVLLALAKGIPLVTSEWILSSVDSDGWLDPTKFKCKAFPGASTTSDEKLFEGKLFYIGPRTKMNRDALINLITSAGGELAATASGAHIGISGDRMIIGAAKDAAVVKEEWLYDALSEGKLPSTSSPKYKVEK